MQQWSHTVYTIASSHDFCHICTKSQQNDSTPCFYLSCTGLKFLLSTSFQMSWCFEWKPSFVLHWHSQYFASLLWLAAARRLLPYQLFCWSAAFLPHTIDANVTTAGSTRLSPAVWDFPFLAIRQYRMLRIRWQGEQCILGLPSSVRVVERASKLSHGLFLRAGCLVSKWPFSLLGFMQELHHIQRIGFKVSVRTSTCESQVQVGRIMSPIFLLPSCTCSSPRINILNFTQHSIHSQSNRLYRAERTSE